MVLGLQACVVTTQVLMSFMVAVTRIEILDGCCWDCRCFYTCASPCGMLVLLYGPVVNLFIQVHMGFFTGILYWLYCIQNHLIPRPRSYFDG